jgi:hypothetical protein
VEGPFRAQICKSIDTALAPDQSGSQTIRLSRSSEPHHGAMAFHVLAVGSVIRELARATPHQCRGCGTFASARIRRASCGDRPVTAAICLSENASSSGAISRLNQ